MKKEGFSTLKICSRRHGSSPAVFEYPGIVKNVLKFPGDILKNHSAFVWLLIAVIFFLGVTSANHTDLLSAKHSIHNFAAKNTMEAYRVNISQYEYKQKMHEFFDLLKQKQKLREEKGEIYDGENVGDKRLFSFPFTKYKWSSNKPYEFKFDVDIPHSVKKNSKIEDVSIRFEVVPKHCDESKGVVTLDFRVPHQITQKEEYHLGLCAPKWVGLSLTETFNLKKKVNVEFECDTCEEEKLKLTNGYLNIIMQEVKETRRAGNQAWPGRCARREWRVDLSKIPGFAHVVEPKMPDLGLCMGNCTELKHFPNQHSHLRYLVALTNNTIPKGCCSTSKMISLDVMYADENDPKKLTRHVWNDTVAVECECY